MKYYKFSLIVYLCLLGGGFAFPQGTGTIFGRVVDAATKEPLIGANIIIPGTNYGDASDEKGEYKITGLPLDMYELKASSGGYSNFTKTDINVTASRPVEVDFELNASAITFKDITVSAGYFNNNPLEVNSVTNFSYEDIRRAPGGFEDVVRALSVLPGVAQADAGRNDLIVRGGAPSENLYLVDGIPVPNINHFGNQGATGGPLSFINLDFVRNTSFSTGGFPVLYGDKISSVLSINLRDGRTDKLGGKATVSASQFGLNLEGPLAKNSSFIFSVRRSYLDFIFKAAGFGFVPEYYDLLSKADFNFDNGASLSFLFIGALDRVKFFNNTADQRYDNSMVLGSDQNQYVSGLRYRSLFKNGFFNLTLSRNYTDYNSVQKDSLLNPIFSNISSEAENSLRADVTYKLSSNSEISSGAEFNLIQFGADVLFPRFVSSFGDTLSPVSLNETKNFTKAGAYLNYNLKMFDRANANFGLRFDYFSPLKNNIYLSPRFSATYRLSGLDNLNFSTGIYYQSPAYIWLAEKGNASSLKDIKAVQYVLGYERMLRDDLRMKIEFYLKDYSNYPAALERPYLVLANTGAGFTGSEDNFSSFGLEPLVSAGRGSARGIEISLQKKMSSIPLYGILSLTYGKSDYVSLDGIERTGSYDQPLIFNLSGGYKFNKEWEASFKFRYSSGKPYTPFSASGLQSAAGYNSARLSPINSLDLRVDKRWFLGTWSLITYIDVQNVYNHRNESGVTWDARTQSVMIQKSIGLLPSIGVSAEF